MEQFVLGFFQEQLSKVIVGFRKEQVNANLLNGKGEITDVSLNCSVINEAVRRVSPLLEFEEIHVSRLGFHVTSWANLRKAPIVVDIGIITAVVQEPLECVPKNERRKLRIVTERELVQLILQGFKPLRGNGSYGFADRIVDNLTIEIETFKLSYQTWGKFKTRRIGPWTPPAMNMEIHHLKIAAVDQYGCEGTPDQVWQHNRMGMKEFLLYKKVSGEVFVTILDTYAQKHVNLIEKLAFETQLAVKRRLRDGAILGVQADVTVPSVYIEVETFDTPILAHWVAASKYLIGKEKTFEDPLVQATHQQVENIASPVRTDAESGEGAGQPIYEEEEVEGDDGDDADDESVDEDHNDSNSIEEYVDVENDIGEKQEQVQQIQQSLQTSQPRSMNAPYKQKPIIILPNGLVIYETVCVTCSIHNITVRGVYKQSQNGYIQFSSKGCITELIWPKGEDDPGLFLQSSISFMSIQERLNRQVKTILLGGVSHGDHMSIHTPSPRPNEINADENFPLFERRSIRDDPLDLRHTFPSQAFGSKMTVDVCLSREDCDQPPMALHEIGTDEFDIVLDTDAWCRALLFFLNEDGGGFDSRWYTGDWADTLTPSMLKDPKRQLQLDDHLHNPKLILLDENSMISSDRFNVTARFSNVEIRIPAAINENVRSCDILVKVDETTIIVSSALPRTFLSGKIGNSIHGDVPRDEAVIDFPNDPSDIAYSLEGEEDPSLRLSGVHISRAVSTFRTQATSKGFEVKISPIIPFCNAMEPQQLIAPMDMTMIACFEGEPPPPGTNHVKIVLFLTMQIQRFHLNIDFDLLAGSTSTLLHHHDIVADIVHKASELIASSGNHDRDFHMVEDNKRQGSGKVQIGLKGRQVLVRKHLAQSRETGGLSIVFCIQLLEYGFTLWRQNVPYTSPFRHDHVEDSKLKSPDHSWLHESTIPLVKLVDVRLKDLEFGVEFDFRVKEGRRAVAKLCLQEGRIMVCNVRKAMGYVDTNSLLTMHDVDPKQNVAAVSEWNLVELMTFGIQKLPGSLNSSYSGATQQVALRLEEQMKNETRSWSLSADLNSPTTINICIEEVRDTVLLLFEALLLPSWSKREFLTVDESPFPTQTIGAMFSCLVAAAHFPQAPIEIPWEQLSPENRIQTSDPIVERTLRMIFKLFFPADLQLVLLRLEIANLLLLIPDKIDDKVFRSLGLHLMQTDLALRFYPIPGLHQSEMEDVLACKGIAWSTLIKTAEDGYYQNIRSRQSLLSVKSEGAEIIIEELVNPFHVDLTYSSARFHLAMNEDMKVNDIRKIESFVSGIKVLQTRVVQYFEELQYFVAVAKQPSQRAPGDNAEVVVFEDANTDPSEVQEVQQNTTNIPNVQSILRMMEQIHTEIALHTRETQVLVLGKHDEIETLRKQLFEKERHRFAALALLSSRIAGWVRTGGVHRTGQRVARKSTLWPNWAVLRKNLLLLYTSPGNPKPLDVIRLNGAKIRQLAGGRSRQDVKRGFAIIERGGTTRYFIVSTSQEFVKWVQEIDKAIAAFPSDNNQDNEKDDFGSALDNPIGFHEIDQDAADESSHATEFQTIDGASSGRARGIGNRFAGAKNRIGAALETARQKGKEISERRRDPSQAGEDGNINSKHGAWEERESFGIAENLSSAETMKADPSSGGNKRRMQLGKAFTGMKEVTKNKIGTAIQSARQRSTETQVTSQTPPRYSTSANGKGSSTDLQDLARSDDLIASAPDRSANITLSLICEACTFINDVELGEEKYHCQMCGTPLSLSENVASSGETLGFKDGRTQQDGSKRNRLGTIGAAVFSSRQNSMEDDSSAVTQEANGVGPRFNFRRRRQDEASDQLFDGGPITLKKVHASGFAPSVSKTNDEEIPLKQLDGNWIVAVKYILPKAKSCERNESVPGVGENGVASISGINVGNATDDDAPMSTIDASYAANTPVQDVCYDHFLIRSKREDSDGVGHVTEVSRTLGMLLELHATASESVATLLTRLTRDLEASDSEGEKETPCPKNNIDLVDSVLVSGRLLGGFLEEDLSEQYLKKTAEYQAEIIEWFLNALLRCPLPIELLMQISELLGITASTKDYETKSQPPGGHNEISFSVERPKRILSMLASCETELLRAERSIAVTPKERCSFSTPSPEPSVSKEFVARSLDTRLYEPLLPPSVSTRMQEAMHDALVNIMAERDEAHAQLIASNVLHVHELEQERRLNEKLRIEHLLKEERGKLQQPNVASFLQNFGDDTAKRNLHAKLDKFERMLSNNADNELAETSRQLADETSAKTSHALEVVRLKECHEIERQNDADEKQALKDELRRVKALLAEQKEKIEGLEKRLKAEEQDAEQAS